MLQDCQNDYNPKFEQSCCLKHMLELYSLSEERFLIHKYYKFFIKTFHYLTQNNKLFQTDVSLQNSTKFLNVLSKGICHFFMLQKIKFGKFLSKIAIKFLENSMYKDHPDIIVRFCAVKNNLACIYEKEHDYSKAIRELNFCKKFLVTNIDKIIFYHNLVRLSTKKDNSCSNADVFQSSQEWKKALVSEIENIKNEKLHGLSNENILYSNTNLVAFSCFNYAFHVENNLKDFNEAKEFYRYGYEFSLCMLNEESFIVEKFKKKIEEFTLNQIEDNSILISDEEDLLESELKKKEEKLNNKLEKILSQLEILGKKIDTGEIDQSENENLIEQTEKIKEMLRDVNIKKKKLDEKSNDTKRDSTKVGSGDGISSLDGTPAKPKPTKTVKQKKKKEEIVCKDKAGKGNDRTNEELNNLTIDKKIQKFYSSDDNSIMSQINLLDHENSNLSEEEEEEKKKKKSTKVDAVPGVQVDEVEEKLADEAVTYYQKVTDLPPSIQVDLDGTENDKFECITYYQKVGEVNDAGNASCAASSKFAQYISSENKIANEIFQVKSAEFDINLFFDSLAQPSSQNDVIRQVRYVKTQKFILTLNPNKEGIQINLYKPNTTTSVTSVKFDYFKLKTLIKKLSLYLSLGFSDLFSSIKTVTEFTRKFLINYISCQYNEGIKFGMSPNAVGVFLKKSINIKVRHVMCNFDMLILNKNEVKILLSSVNNEAQIVSIHTVFDDMSFSEIFVADANYPEIYILKSSDYSEDSNIVNLGKNCQKLINNFCVGKFNTFEDLCASKGVSFYAKVTDHCQEMMLRGAEFGDRLFKVTELTAQGSGKNEGLIYSCEMKILFGYEIADLNKRINEFEKTALSQFILNSVHEDEKSSKIALSAFEVLDSYKFCFENKVCSFEYVNIGDNRYIKMLIYYPLTQQEHTKIFFLKSSSAKDLKKFNFEQHEAKIRKLFHNSLHNLTKGQDSYIELFEI